MLAQLASEIGSDRVLSLASDLNTYDTLAQAAIDYDDSDYGDNFA